MKLKSLFIFNAIATIIFGIGSVLAPQVFISLFGANLNPAGLLMMQYGGTWLIGIGLLAQFDNVLDTFGWGMVALKFLLALSYGYFLFVKPGTA
jgi:hypothetical protein